MKPLRLMANRRNTTAKIAGTTALLLSTLLAGAYSSEAAAQSDYKGAQPISGVESSLKQEQSRLRSVGTRLVYSYEYTMAGAAYVERVLVLYNDGTFTRDFDTILTRGGAAASRRSNPRMWGTWRIDPEDDFVYRYSESSKWRDHASTPSIATGTNYQLDGCYTSQKTVSLPGASSLSFNTFCFDNNGYFSNERTRSALSPDAIAGSYRNKAGSYEIDGRLLVLRYGNGNVVPSLIGVYAGGAQISVNGTVFTRQN